MLKKESDLFTGFWVTRTCLCKKSPIFRGPRNLLYIFTPEINSKLSEDLSNKHSWFVLKSHHSLWHNHHLKTKWNAILLFCHTDKQTIIKSVILAENNRYIRVLPLGLFLWDSNKLISMMKLWWYYIWKLKKRWCPPLSVFFSLLKNVK